MSRPRSSPFLQMPEAFLRPLQFGHTRVRLRARLGTAHAGLACDCPELACVDRVLTDLIFALVGRSRSLQTRPWSVHRGCQSKRSYTILPSPLFARASERVRARESARASESERMRERKVGGGLIRNSTPCALGTEGSAANDAHLLQLWGTCEPNEVGVGSENVNGNSLNQ